MLIQIIALLVSTIIKQTVCGKQMENTQAEEIIDLATQLLAAVLKEVLNSQDTEPDVKTESEKTS